jgi:hypothetical protein
MASSHMLTELSLTGKTLEVESSLDMLCPAF